MTAVRRGARDSGPGEEQGLGVSELPFFLALPAFGEPAKSLR
jgi:hypothetical protein